MPNHVIIDSACIRVMENLICLCFRRIFTAVKRDVLQSVFSVYFCVTCSFPTSCCCPLFISRLPATSRTNNLHYCSLKKKSLFKEIQGKGWGIIYVYFKELLPPANEVWSKVMFVNLSVSHSVHGGGGRCLPLGPGMGRECLPLGPGVVHSPGHPRGHIAPGHTHLLDTHPTYPHTPGHPPVEMAIEAGGTHPTGMLSCSTCMYLKRLHTFPL